MDFREGVGVHFRNLSGLRLLAARCPEPLVRVTTQGYRSAMDGEKTPAHIDPVTEDHGAAQRPPVAGEIAERQRVFAYLAADGIDVQPYEDLADLLQILRSRPLWQASVWLRQPHARLDGETPLEALARDPAAVLDAARSTYEPGDTNW